MTHISRRDFVALAATGAAAAPLTGSRQPSRGAITAQAVVDRIRQHVGVAWKPETVDTFKAGDPAAIVTGIATTAMATMDVLKQALKAKANLVITCEPTFYGRRDLPTPPAGRGGAPADPVFSAKHDFIRDNALIVWRFSDHWRLRKPDPFSEGLADALGWSGYRDAADPARVTISAITLDRLASEVKKKLAARGGLRVVGDPRIEVRRIGFLPGSTPLQAGLAALQPVDTVIAGEVREWETVEYARDIVTAGGKKALILLGRVLSEEPGMAVCARWLATIVPEVRTSSIRVGDPYWRPL